MLSQSVHIPDVIHGKSEKVRSSLVRLARSVEDSRIHELIIPGDAFVRWSYRFAVINRKNVRMFYEAGKASKEFYLIFAMKHDSKNGSDDGEHLLIHFGTVNGEPEKLWEEGWFTEMVVVDTEFERKTFSEELEREALELGGDAPIIDAARLAGFAIASVMEEYSGDENIVARVLDRTRDDARNAVSPKVQ